MNQHIGVADIISVEILYLEVINVDWILKQFVLNLLNYNIFSVQKLKSVACSKLTRFSPSFNRYIKRMTGSCNYLLSVNILSDETHIPRQTICSSVKFSVRKIFRLDIVMSATRQIRIRKFFYKSHVPVF